MTDSDKLPIIFLAFANPPAGAPGHLRNLGEEARRLENTLKQAEQNGLCELVVKPYAGLDEILAVFREHRNRIAIFHYAGHAKNFELLLEDAAKGTVAIDGRGLAAFLGQQTGLQLVFLNGCSTQPQVEELLAANVPAVIATSQAIRDDVATRLAGEFYASLTSGATIQSAFTEAQGAAQAMIGSGSVRDAYLEEVETVADRWPWSLTLKPGAELVAQWNLPDAADDPVFGLPPLPQLDLPESPFRHLNYFTQADAEIFFGRGRQIRALHDRATAPDSPPIILFYGQSGVGKSSVLAAGLLPRLEASHEVRYTRRERELGLLGTLEQTLNQTSEVSKTSEVSTLTTRWHATEQNQPLVIILDQVEETFTRPNPTQPNELADFLTALEPLFVRPDNRPKGKLILSFRKEWLAEIEQAMKSQHLPRTKLFLERLEWQGIIEAVEGVSRQARLQQHYGLTVEPKLPKIIADDLLEDPESSVAPTLQILLTKMWDQATAKNPDQPQFTQNLYQDLKRGGILLADFLDQQLAKLQKLNEPIVTSGLAIDVLAYHTTFKGTAEQRPAADLLDTYSHRETDIPPLVQQCEDLYLLVDPSKNQSDQAKASRLAHDALAPLVRSRLDESDAPGQRARRILESRAVDWVDDEGKPKESNPLDEADLTLVEAGRPGMRELTEAEERLLTASRAAQTKRERNRMMLWGTGILAIILILISAIAFFLQRNEAERQARRSKANEIAVIAGGMKEPKQALAYALKAAHTTWDEDGYLTPNAIQALQNTLIDDKQFAIWTSANESIPQSDRSKIGYTWISFSPAGELIVTAGIDGLAKVWDTKSRTQVLTYTHSYTFLNSAIFSEDGKYIIAAGLAGVAVWEAQSKKQLWFADQERVDYAEFSPNEERVVTAAGNSIVIRDAKTGKELDRTKVLDLDTIWIATFRFDGKRILVAGAGGSSKGRMITVLDSQTLDILLQIDSSKYLPETETPDGDGGVLGAEFSPDGQQILTTHPEVAMIWDAETGEKIFPLSGQFQISSAQYDKTGTKIVTGSHEGTVTLWNATTQQEIFTFKAFPEEDNTFVAISPDGKQIATVNRGDHVVKMWPASPQDWLERAESFNTYQISDNERLLYGIE